MGFRDLNFLEPGKKTARIFPELATGNLSSLHDIQISALEENLINNLIKFNYENVITK